MGMFMERCVELIEIAICSTTIFLVENISYLTFFHNEMTATFLFRRKKWLIPSVVSNLDEHRKRKKIRPDVPNREKKNKLAATVPHGVRSRNSFDFKSQSHSLETLSTLALPSQRISLPCPLLEEPL